MNTDLDLSLEDEVEEPLGDDELQRYLEDDVDEDSDEAKARRAEEEEARLQAIVDRKIADRFTRRDDEEPKKPVTKPEYREEQTPNLGNEEEIFDKMADDLVADLAVDPKQAFKKMLKASKALANQSGEIASARANRNLVENFRASRRSDPIFNSIEDDFDTIIDKWSDTSLGKATTAQVRQALHEAEDMATGRYYKAQLAAKKAKKSVDPPNYGGGGSGSARGGSSPRALSNEDRILISMGKSAKLSDKEIKELLRESRK